MDFWKDLVHDHFDKLFLMAIFGLCIGVIGMYPENEPLVDFVKSSAVIGAIIGLITGQKMRNGNGANGGK